MTHVPVGNLTNLKVTCKRQEHEGKIHRSLNATGRQLDCKMECAGPIAQPIAKTATLFRKRAIRIQRMFQRNGVTNVTAKVKARSVLTMPDGRYL